ncbi:MAG: helix-turn-helix domain-containing protein [Bacteroidales bacterium]
MSKYLLSLINEGENQQLDFKHSISDSKKIARSLVAFANTQGGTLLIGVKDNGKITGINSDEEYYMLEGAAQLYCKPEVKFNVKRWDVNGKVVLEVYIAHDARKLYKAPFKDGKWKVFFRVNDENILATPLQVRVWKAKRYRKPIQFNLSDKDQKLIKHLNTHGTVSVEEYSRIGFISRKESEEVLINLAVMGIVNLVSKQEGEYFEIVQDPTL